ncbi:hypothetical protein GCM10028777_36490 [Angustibacter speluncae]
MRDRVVPALACVVTLVAGLAVAASDLPVADKPGDLLYAALVTLGVWFLAPRAPLAVLAGVAGTWCLAVELLQLTDVPRLAADRVPLARFVLGSGFDAWDLVAYAGGVLLALGVVAVTRRRRRP